VVTGDLSISLQGSFFLLALLLIVGIAIAVLFYRYTLPPLPPRRRWFLSVLRAGSVSLLLLLLFEPILHLARHEAQQPVIAVLVDNSQSMTITDGSGNRADAVRQWVNGEPARNLRTVAGTRFFLFSSRIRQTSNLSGDSLNFSGETTDLSQALVRLKEQSAKENIQAAVLLSDGNYNVGKNPLYDAEALGIPLYAVGVGDTNEQKDVLVEKVLTNDLAYADTRLPVDVMIKSSGYNGERVEVELVQGGSVVDRKVVTLAEGTREYPVRLFLEPHEEGMMKYAVTVSQLPGELTGKNNVKSFFVKVLKSKLRVLVLSGAANSDVPVVRQALVEDGHLAVHSFVQKNSGDFYEGVLSPSQIDSADCLVLIGFPSSFSAGAVLQRIVDAMDHGKKPLLFINAKTVDYSRLRALEPFLPFTWLALSAGEVYVAPAVNERYKAHPLVNLGGDVTVDSWQQLPPIYKVQGVFRAKAESDVLVSVRIENIPVNEALVLTRNVNGRKSFAVTGYGIWRWRLMAQGNRETANFLPLLLTNAVRWLTTKEDEKNVRIIPTKEAFSTAEPVEFTAQVYDEQLRPVDNAEVNVELTHGQETSQIALNAIGNGRYEGSTEGLSEGDYTFAGKAKAGGTAYGEDKGKFSVGQMNVEFLETKMNEQLLEQLAFRAGGKYYNIANSGNLAGDMKSAVTFSQKELVQKSELELWNWQYLAAVIVLLLGVEWFVRKRNGML